MSTSYYDLPELLTPDACQALRQTCLDLAAQAASVTLDAGQVMRLTTPALQVLCALDKALEASGARLFISPASEAFVQACADFGCHDQYQRWSSAC